MPGPYCTAIEVYRQTQSRLGQAAESELPEHWIDLANKARSRGYQRLIGILGGRGYSLSAIDTWDGRSTYNLDYAVAYAFMYGAFRRGEDAPSPRAELERIDKELSDPSFMLFDTGGSILTPDLVVGTAQVSYGRSTNFDDDVADFRAWKDGYVDDDGLSYAVVEDN